MGSLATRMIARIQLAQRAAKETAMRSLALALAVTFAASSALPGIAEARRIGGGGAVGMQRSLPPATPTAVPARPVAPAAQPAPAPTAAATPAAAPRRSWMGPIAGLAAGLGIAALMSHLGLGAEFGNILMMVLLAAAAFFVVRFLMRRFMPSNPTNGGRAACSSPAPARRCRRHRHRSRRATGAVSRPTDRRRPVRPSRPAAAGRSPPLSRRWQRPAFQPISTRRRSSASPR